MSARYTTRNDRWHEHRRRAEDRTFRAGAVAALLGGLGTVLVLLGTNGLREFTLVTKYALVELSLVVAAGLLLWLRKSIAGGVFLVFRHVLLTVLMGMRAERAVSLLVGFVLLLLYLDGVRGAIEANRLNRVPATGAGAVRAGSEGGAAADA